MISKTFTKEKIVYFLIMMIAFLIFIGIYSIRVINPCYTDWLLTGADPSQHYLGWCAYRTSEWHFPIGMVDNLAYPNFTSIIFTDSIPILAVLFKLVSPLLPSEFQYFGIWGLMCFILQGIITGKIVSKYTHNNILIIVSSALSILTPVMIYRMFVHTALAGQWLLLYTIWVYIYREKFRTSKSFYIHISMIAILSSSIHIYFVLMNGIIIVGLCIADILENKRVIRSIAILVNYVSCTACTVYLLGGFSSGAIAQNSGLGIFSFNLNGFINPQGWSVVINDLPLWGEGQYEGFGYLGLGFIFLLLICIPLTIIKKGTVLNHWKVLVSLIVIFIAALIVSLSPIITYGNKVLFELNLPNYITDKWAIFRASGRVIWVCIYILEISSFIILCKCIKETNFITMIVCIALLMQIFDIHKVLLQKHSFFSKVIEYDSKLKTKEFWNIIGENTEIKHIVYDNMPESEVYYSVTDWALINNKTVSNFYFARPIDEEVKISKDMAFSNLSDDSIYIFTEDNSINCLRYNLTYYNVDGVVVGYPKKIGKFATMKSTDFKLEWIFSGNQYISAESGRDTDNGREIYADGLSYGPYWYVPSGTYLVTIKGNNIPELLEVITNSEQGNKNHKHNIMEQTNGEIIFELHLEEDVSDLEILLKNNSDRSAFVQSITLQYLSN